MRLGIQDLPFAPPCGTCRQCNQRGLCLWAHRLWQLRSTYIIYKAHASAADPPLLSPGWFSFHGVPGSSRGVPSWGPSDESQKLQSPSRHIHTQILARCPESPCTPDSTRSLIPLKTNISRSTRPPLILTKPHFLIIWEFPVWCAGIHLNGTWLPLSWATAAAASTSYLDRSSWSWLRLRCWEDFYGWTSTLERKSIRI